MGTFNAGRLKKIRKKARLEKRKYRVRIFNLAKKLDPLEGSPQARGLVLSKRQVEQRQPHSGMLKCARVKLIKNGKEITAHLPRDGALKHVQEHDEVTVEYIGGSQKKAYGSLGGVKYRVFQVNGISLDMLRRGKKQRATK